MNLPVATLAGLCTGAAIAYWLLLRRLLNARARLETLNQKMLENERTLTQDLSQLRDIDSPHNE